MTLSSQPLLVSLWIAIMIAQGYVLALLVAGRGYREYPAFTAFISFCVVRSLVLFYLATNYSWLYQPVKWATFVLPQLPILVALVREVFHILFHPYSTLPKRTIGHFVQGTVAIGVVAIVVAIRFPGAQPTTWMTLARAMDQAVSWVLCFVFAFIAIFASYFGVPWRHRVSGIGFGFLLYLSVEVTVTTVVAQYRLPVYSPMSYLSMTAFLAACGIWAYYFRSAEVSRSVPTLEELETLKALLGDLGATVNRVQWTPRSDPREL